MNTKISTAWQIAREELGVRVVAPYEARTGSGEVVVCAAYLPDFGSPTGAIVLGYNGTGVLRTQFDGLWCSVAYEPYEVFDRTLFVETLNDWGWFGPSDNKPNWYGGPQTS